MQLKTQNLPFVAAAFILIGSAARGEPSKPVDPHPLRVASLFTDHMVLQRDKPVPVWGMARPGGAVRVRFAGQTKTTKADREGRWQLDLDAMPASKEGRGMTVESEADRGSLRFSDVLVGDVWLASGQSNMAFQMSRVADSKKEIADANHPMIRFFKVGDQFAMAPRRNVKGQWRLASPETVAECSGVGYYFARALQQKLEIPVGLIVSSVGGTRIETWMQQETLARLGLSETLLGKWKDTTPEQLDQVVAAYLDFQNQRDRIHPKAVQAARQEGKPVPPEPVAPKLRGHDCPGALHNGMIAPLQPYALRGVIWYQGEGNSGQPDAYEKLQPALISDWRGVWGAEMPFLFVQLAPHKSIHPSFREAQFRIWKNTPHTAMVVTTDVGNATDIHPTRKQPVGERLALAARALSHGEDIPFSGPVFTSMKVDGNRAVLSFENTDGGLLSEGGPLKGFTIAGKDDKFHPANAVIDGNQVIVSSDQVTRPKAVRYAWAHVPDVNLFNGEKLPAVPFRSDAP